ncbi:MAG TPA: hypothetical protein VGQ99_22305 [Tepidisphaeraceae bacterium]|nr:hypothetical protein [Tepidisphaeraceae bacterium]
MRCEKRISGVRAMVEALEERWLMSATLLSLTTVDSESAGNTYYVGTANGGIWKTKDGGSTAGASAGLTEGSGR